MTRGALVLALAACGRVGFDPLGDDGGADPDAPASSDGTTTIDGPQPDAAPNVCASALLVGLGRSAVLSTCGRGNRLDGCAGADVEDLLVKFIAPASRGYNFAAKDPGTENVSNSISRVGGACSSITSCAGILSFAMSAGESAFFVVEAASGSCANVEIDIQ